MNEKLIAYRKELWRFQEVFENPFYLFVIEAPKYEVAKFSEKMGENFYAVDAKSFFEIPEKEQLAHPIYIWGGDGQTYPLG
jgi:hypothetical protein